MLFIAIWSTGAVFEQMLTDLNYKIFWSVITYFGIPFTPVLLLIFVLRFSQQDSWLNKRKTILLFVAPVISLIMAITNTFHHLLWPTVTIISGIGGVTAKYEHGIWFWVTALYSYTLIFTATILLIRASLRFSNLFANQSKLFLTSLIFPWIISIGYTLKSDLFDYVEPTPIAFTLTGLFISLGIYRYYFLDIIPIARNLLFDNFRDGILVFDYNNRIIDSNHAIEKILNKHNLIGNSIDSELSEIPALLNLCLKKESGKLELHIDNIILGASLIDIKDKRNQFIGTLLTLQDITQKKKEELALLKSEQDLKELNSAKDKFFSIIAHDLKNPFFGIIGLSEILHEDYNELSEEEKKKLVQEILELARNTHRMLENLLDWSRQQTGNIKFHPKLFNIKHLIDDNFVTAQQQADLKNIKLLKNYIDITVFADENMINTIVRNLISNAIKFTLPGGSIEASAKQNNDHAEISVKDTGVGMDNATLEKLFRIDQNIKSTGTFGETGTGIGLILCKEFIEMNKGKITVESISGKGSVFTFTLPVK